MEVGLGMRLGGSGLFRGPGLPILGGKVPKKWSRTLLFYTTNLYKNNIRLWFSMQKTALP